MNPDTAVDHILKNAGNFAKAKSERVYLEEFRKCKKAILMAQSPEPTAVAREQWAYSHSEYLELIVGLKNAVEVEEKLRWELIAAQARIDIWRTRQANNRMIEKATA